MGDSPEEKALAHTIAVLDQASAPDVVASVGALLLVPANLHYRTSLECVLGLVMTGACGPSGSLSCETLDSLLNESVASWAGHLDDLWPSAATEAFTFHGGTHVFIPGGDGICATLRCLAEAVCDDDLLPATLAQRCIRMIQGMCLITDLSVRRAKLDRNAEVPTWSDSIHIPPAPQLDARKQNVCLGAGTVERILRDTGMNSDDLDAFTWQTMSSSHELGTVVDTLAYKPLFSFAEGLIVAAPHWIAHALVWRICDLVMRSGQQRILAEHLHVARLSHLRSLLARMDVRLVDIAEESLCAHSFVTHTLWTWDADKVLHLAFFSDALSCNEPATLFGSWQTDEIQGEVHRGRAMMLERVRRRSASLEVFSLIVTADVGRSYSVGFDRNSSDIPDGQMLGALSISDLEILMTRVASDGADFLTVVKFLTDMWSESRLRFIAILDAFGLWRASGCSFFGPDDDGTSKGMVIPGAYSADLHSHSLSVFDWHAIRVYGRSSLVEVGRLSPSGHVYVPRHPKPRGGELAVEVGSTVVWVRTVRSTEPSVLKNGAMQVEFLRLFTYWIAEAVSAVNGSVLLDPALLEIDLGPYEPWAALQEGQASVDAGYTINRIKSDHVVVQIKAEFALRYDDSNAAELELVSAAADALLEGVDLKCRNDLKAFFEKSAQTSDRRILNLTSTRTPEYIASDAQHSVRYVQDYARVPARRGRAMPGSTPATLTDAEATSWLNETVGALFQELRQRLASLDKRAALHRLMAANEGLVFLDRHRVDTLAARDAIGSSATTVVTDVMRQLNRHAEAAMPTRFLIEYLAAERSGGTGVLSGTEHDACLAIAAEIVRLGVASDIAHFKLAPIAVDLFARDYSVRKDQYEDATHQMGLQFTRELVGQAYSRGGTKPKLVQAVDAAKTSSTLERASRTEFGHSFQEMATFVDAATRVASEANATVVTMDERAFVALIAERCSFTESATKAILTRLSLEPRPNFLKVPSEEFADADVYPWRFNRALSYVSRPFVFVPSPVGREVSYTPGHVARAVHLLVESCIEGRYKAKSTEMKTLMSKFTKAASEDFDDEVAETLRTRGWSVATRVLKIGSKRIAVGGNDLGDIDVLAADPAKKQIWGIECKDFSRARLPNEVRADLTQLFGDEGGGASTQDKHLLRVTWLQENLDAVVRKLKCDPADGTWSIEGAIVLSAALMAPKLAKPKLRIWTLQELALREEI
ncbi:MAG: hypothetical protein IPK60_04870 [Sandaracinaceae bacterium]|nr:hypothetical protein [Sandaracinaceae bacterium]